MARLLAHVEGKIEMSATQVNAAKILLSKIVPDLGRTEVTGEDGGPLKVVIQRFSDGLGGSGGIG